MSGARLICSFFFCFIFSTPSPDFEEHSQKADCNQNLDNKKFYQNLSCGPAPFLAEMVMERKTYFGEDFDLEEAEKGNFQKPEAAVNKDD